MTLEILIFIARGVLPLEFYRLLAYGYGWNEIGEMYTPMDLLKQFVKLVLFVIFLFFGIQALKATGIPLNFDALFEPVLKFVASIWVVMNGFLILIHGLEALVKVKSNGI